MKRNRKRYALAALAAFVVATSSFAFAAQNNMTGAGSNAGSGDAAVSGYTVTNVSWDLLDTEWTFDTGEITPTMKLKRNVIAKKYEEKIAKLFA